MPLSNATYGKDPTMADEPAQPDPVPVAEQKAAGVPPEETVTVAEQKQGTPPPDAVIPNQPPGNGPAAPQLHPELYEQVQPKD